MKRGFIQYLILGTLALLMAGGYWLYNTSQGKNAGAGCLIAAQGGTGKCSALVGDVGKVLTVSDDSPFTYTLSSASSLAAPSSPDTSIQFNSDGRFDGDDDFTYSSTTKTLTIGSNGDGNIQSGGTGNTLNITSSPGNAGGGSAGGINIIPANAVLNGDGGSTFIGSGAKNGAGTEGGVTIEGRSGIIFNTLTGQFEFQNSGTWIGTLDVTELSANGTAKIPNIGGTTDHFCFQTLANCGVSSSFPFTKETWGVSTGTTIGLLNGFISTASSTITAPLLDISSTTIYKLTSINSTSTNATSSTFALANASAGCAQFTGTGQLSSTGSGCASAYSLTGSFNPFTLTTYNTQTVESTSTGVWFKHPGLGIIASSTFTTRATTTEATTTNFAITHILQSLLATDANGTVVATSTIGNNQLQNSSLTINTSAPITGSATVSLGGSMTVACATCLTANQTITLSGDVTGSGATSILTSIAPTTRDWKLFSASILQPTTTPMGIYVQNSTSTVTNLSMITSTSTRATSTNFAISTNLNFGGDVLTDLTGSGLTNSAGVLTCATSDTSTFGCLTNTDWNTFNSKLSSYDAFTHGTYFASGGSFNVSATTSPIRLTANTGLIASSTFATRATTTDATTTTFAISALLSKLLATDGNGTVVGAALTFTGDVSGSSSAGATSINLAENAASKEWKLFSASILQPTTTPMGIYVQNSTSTITNLAMYNSTSTNATSSTFALSNASAGCAQFTGTGQLSSTGSSCGSSSGLTAYDAFTHTTYNGQTVSATSSGILFSHPGIGVIASSTFSTRATTTDATTTTFAITKLLSQLLSTESNGTVLGTTVNSPLSFSSNSLSCAGCFTAYDAFLHPTSVISATTTSIQASSFLGTGASNLGSLGVASSSPWGRLSVGTNNLALASPAFVIASSSTGLATTTQLIVVNGKVGIASTSPNFQLAIGTNDSGTFGISTSTAGCAAFSVLGQLYSTGSVCAAASGDITSVGDVASGAAFDGTQGTTLTFFNGGGNATLDYDGTDFTFSKIVNTALGSVSAPSYSFSGDLNTGMWSPGANLISWTTNGSEKLTLTEGGAFGIGSTSPWAQLSVASSSPNYTLPLFSVSTSTSIFGQLLNVFATTSTKNSNALLDIGAISPADSGVRVDIGNFSSYQPLLLDQLSVNGRINTGEWFEGECNGFVAASVAATTNSFCGVFSFREDTTGQASVQTNPVGMFTLEEIGANAGGGVFASSVLNLKLATSTPILEFTISAGINQGAVLNNASSTMIAGFFNTNPQGTTWEVLPTAGCYITATTTTKNFQAVCQTSSSAITQVDTGVSSTSPEFTKWRIETDSNSAKFYQQGTSTKMFLLTEISGANYPSTTALGAGVYSARATAGLQTNFALSSIRFWVRKSLWPN